MTVDRRFQVFLSSTYKDLQAERAAVIQSLLELKCLPLAMDFFPAASERPWELIAREIDSCDYFIVLLAGRYGSLDSEGMGYTEREYSYALQQGKPILTFLHGNLDALTGDRLERTDNGRRLLDAFRERLMKGHLLQFFSTAAELGKKTTISMIRLMQDHPAIGWVRADQAAKENGRLFSINECAREMIERASQCGDDEALAIEAVGLDMSIACEYMAEMVRVCKARTLSCNILVMTNDSAELGPLAPDDVAAWTTYVDGSIKRMANGFRNAVRTYAKNQQTFSASLRQYAGLPVVHGTTMKGKTWVSYSSICRFRRSEETYDWGEFSYRRVADDSGSPSDLHLAKSLDGLFNYLWSRSKVRWTCETDGNGSYRETP